jgi:ABC-2 type transport system ATP-binding protein
MTTDEPDEPVAEPDEAAPEPAEPDLAAPAEVRPCPPLAVTTGSVLRTHGVRKRFGRQPVLQGLDLDVREGDVYGFLGRNGAGKTTSMRGMMGILRMDGGTFEFFGERVKRPTRDHKRRIGYVSQEQHFYPWMSCASLGRFVAAFFPDWDDGEFDRLLVALDLPPDRKVSQLSGGMRAKLGLALALAHRPELLLLDEPTSGLDPAARREFLEIVAHQAQADGRTTFFSSHIVEEVERVSSRVGILDKGRVRYEGTLETLRRSVRKIPCADDGPFDAPEGFELLSEQTDAAGERSVVLFALPTAWRASPLDEALAEPMTLEDSFLALTIGRLFNR